MIDNCFGCPVKNYVEDGYCPLPCCLLEVCYGNLPGERLIQAALLWECGETVERISDMLGVNCDWVVICLEKWRTIKRDQGLLI